MKLKHYDHDGRARFITFPTQRNLPILTNNLFRGLIVEETIAICRQFGIRLLAYVVMPERLNPPVGWGTYAEVAASND